MLGERVVSAGALAATIVISGLIFLVWGYDLLLLGSMTGSDPAGDDIGQALAALAMGVLWVLLGVLTLIAIVKGCLPTAVAMAAGLGVALSGLAASAVLGLLARPGVPPFLWPLVIPAGVPPLVVAFAFWALLPSLRAMLSARLAAGIAWGGVLMLCLAIVPLQLSRQRFLDQEAAQQARVEAAFAAMPEAAPLWEWLPFLEPRRHSWVADNAMARIRHLDRRQADAETMLDRGDFPLGQLGFFDLDPTPTLCDKARGLLRRRAAQIAAGTVGSGPLPDFGRQLDDAVSAMQWLVGYDCGCDGESLAWEAVAKTNLGGALNLAYLAELRDPANLGRIVRNYPAKFSMLGPKAHLRAWLRFAEDPAWHDRAIAGARTLDHRTADAVEMLGDEFGAVAVLKAMPVLDLDPTAELCAAARKVLHDDITKVYRPKPDDPRSFQEFLERVRADRDVPALIWLARHDCDVDGELAQVERLAFTYQDSADRSPFLARLASVRGKP